MRNRHRHAIEQASRRWRGGRCGDSARRRREILSSTQVAILGALHVNGVARLLKDPAGYGEGKAGTWWTDDMIEAKPE